MGLSPPDSLDEYLESQRMRDKISKLENALREALDEWEWWMPTKRARSTIAAESRRRLTQMREQYLGE